MNACYRIARLFSRYIHKWDALVPCYATSGVTLICLGSNVIVLSDFAYLGPLDPQVISKRREKFFTTERQSPLEAFQAVKYLRQSSLNALDDILVYLIRNGVAPQTALEAASRMAIELIQPVVGKIEPYDLGAFALNSSLAADYCRRICQQVFKEFEATDITDALVQRYPAHEFVIDFEEASSLGLQVNKAHESLDDIFDNLRDYLGQLELLKYDLVGPVDDKIEIESLVYKTE